MRFEAYIYLILFSGSLSLFLTKLLIKFAPKLGVVDRPCGRKIHKSPVPLLGGLAIYASFIVAILANMWIAEMVLQNPERFRFVPADTIALLGGVSSAWPKLRLVLFGGTAMLLLGLLDDINPVNARLKMLVQATAALALVVFGIRITVFLNSMYLGALITIVWVVGITNAFNLIDNMDGLSSGVACIAAALFFAGAQAQGNYLVAAVLIVFAGSLLGFLRYNFCPARIFMGDTGSLFIGYTLASLAILNTYYTEGAPTFLPVFMPVLILAVPIFDTLSVIFIRIKNSESIFKADKRHFSHRLVNLGLSQPQAVLLVYLVSFCTGAGSILLRQVSFRGALIIVCQMFAIFGIIVALETAGARKSSRKDI